VAVRLDANGRASEDNDNPFLGPTSTRRSARSAFQTQLVFPAPRAIASETSLQQTDLFITWTTLRLTVRERRIYATESLDDNRNCFIYAEGSTKLPGA